MSALDQIKERINKLRSTPTAKLTEYGKEYGLLARVESDHLRLIAAVEAVLNLAVDDTVGWSYRDAITHALENAK